MQEFLTISVLIMLAAISPGPDFAVVTKNSLLYSRRVGIYTAAGVSSSLLIHATYCVLGLAIVISKSLLVFSILKYLGAAYLIYIGIKSLLEKRSKSEIPHGFAAEPLSGQQAFLQGFLCNLLNPKAILFLLAFFTLVVTPSHTLFAEIGYGVEIALIHMIWFSSLSILLTHRAVQNRLHRAQFYIVKMMGALLVAFGVKIALLSHEAAS